MMTCAEMAAHEALAFENGSSPNELMEKVGRRMARTILRDFPEPGRVIAFLGQGHNAGDALVVLRHLRKEGWEIGVRTSHSASKLAPLASQKLAWVKLSKSFSLSPNRLFLLLDGLLGIGANGELRSPIRELAEEMNSLRERKGADIISMDVPTGLNADTGEGGFVKADHTLTVGVPKKGLLADCASDFVGRLSLIEMEELPLPEGKDHLITRELLKPHFPHRLASFHKGRSGRISIVAGSPGLVGAAALACTGALRAGAGLVTLWAEEDMVNTLLPLLPPEIMVRPRGNHWQPLIKSKPDALVIGPGLGLRNAEALFQLLESTDLPTLLDADALNLLAKHQRHDLLRANVLVTPHPGEMARLHPAEGTRADQALSFCHAHSAALLLKGSSTIVTQNGLPLSYNTTGTAGMATGGQGDLLSGVIGAFLARGQNSVIAASAGAWLCGRAAEMARFSHESLTPSDVAAALTLAFQDLRR